MEPELAKFLELFLAESEENLAELESGLLKLERGESADDSLLNQLFRCVHTLKGNAATFGFASIVKLTHSMENLMQEARSHRLKLSAGGCQLLLRVVDGLRELLQAVRLEKPEPKGTEELHRLLENFPGQCPPATSALADPEQRGSWNIRLLPHLDMLARGNDAVLMFRALAELGTLTSQAHFDRIPPLADLDPTLCYLWWEIELRGDIPRTSVLEIFEWVEGDCELTVEPMAGERRPTDSEPKPGPKPQSGSQTPLMDATAATPRQGETRHIRIDSSKIEQLINMVSELVITQSVLQRCVRQGGADELHYALERLDKNTRDLRDSVLKVRMIPVASAFQRLPRLVRELSRSLGKEVELVLEGGEAELDKSLLEQIVDPVMHLVRNCLDHGLENPTQRRAAGKSAMGRLSVRAYHQSGTIVIEVSDDGRGIDLQRLRAKAQQMGMDTTTMGERELTDLIFHPGLSTAQEVSEISGRGVGMDAVRRNVQSLGGSVALTTVAGQGTTFVLRMPLTLAILDGQQIRLGDELYIIPMFSIVECLPWKTQTLSTVAGGQELYFHRDSYIPVVSLAGALGTVRVSGSDQTLMMIVEWAGQRAALLADELLEQQQVVVRSLERNYGKVEGIMGATIAGDGSVALIVDVASLIQSSGALAQV